MIHLSIQVEVKRVVAMLTDAARKQVPFAQAKAVTALAFEVQRAERAAITEMFKHPRPFTQRSVLVEKATKSSPTARVFIKPEAAEYLAPYEFGGVHHAPGRGLGILSPKGIRLDAYGQVRGSPSAIAQRAGVFVGTVETKAGPVWGFWQRVKAKKGGSSLKLLLRATDPVSVHASLGFETRARAIVKLRAAVVFGQELGRALSSARG